MSTSPSLINKNTNGETQPLYFGVLKLYECDVLGRSFDSNHIYNDKNFYCSLKIRLTEFVSYWLTPWF